MKREERGSKLTSDLNSDFLPLGNLSDETIRLMKDLRGKLKRVEDEVEMGKKREEESLKREEAASNWRRLVEVEEVERGELKEFGCCWMSWKGIRSVDLDR